MRVGIFLVASLITGCAQAEDSKKSWMETKFDGGPDTEMTFGRNKGIGIVHVNGIDVDNSKIPEGCLLRITRKNNLRTTEMICDGKKANEETVVIAKGVTATLQTEGILIENSNMDGCTIRVFEGKDGTRTTTMDCGQGK